MRFGIHHGVYRWFVWLRWIRVRRPFLPFCSQLASMKEKASAMKEKVRQTILDAIASYSLIQKLELVDTLQRIGVGYHYRQEIDELLRHVYDNKDEDSDDLYVTSLRFYLLRKRGYPISSDVFLKFKDEKGNVSSNDVNCLMALYDAAHLRTHGEVILDNIITFNKICLQNLIETNLESDLAQEVKITLETPRFRRVERVEAHRYILMYEKSATRDETILRFAKLDYNILQALYSDELKELTTWWKHLQSCTDLRFARDRMVELNFWMLGVLYEPYYSRIMMTKFIVCAQLLDDLYDNCCTMEDSSEFTRVVERWDEQAIEQLPTHLKSFFINIFNTINKTVEDLKLQGNKHAEMVQKLVIDTAKFYNAEVKWREENYVPATIEEHLQTSLCSSVCMQIVAATFVSMGDVTRLEDIEWAFSFPKIIKATSIMARISNDIMSHEREQASTHVVSTVQTCMKQYGVTIEEANDKLRVIIEDAWMDTVEECLDHKHPMGPPKVLLDKVVDVVRTMDFMYKHEDALTIPDRIKDVLTAIYVNPM